MHVSFATALVLSAVIGSVLLVLPRGDRLFPLMALVASGLEALIVWKVIQLSSSKFRIDVILPGLLVLGGAVSWFRAATKGQITASAVVTIVGVLQLFTALKLFR